MRRIFNHGGHGVSQRKNAKIALNFVFLRVLRGYFFFVILHIGLNAAWAQDDPGRPLRTVQPDAPILQSPLPSPQSPVPSPYSLLTPSALEEELTLRYIAQYSSPGGIAWLDTVLKRGSLYLPFIREEIAKRKLPPELAYLPVIESGFLGTARSRSGAVGLWQFMMNSISPFDIKVNDFVDERRDFQKATRGALSKLEDNYRMLGDWALALAAYNAGLGGVSRVIQRTKIRDYWELSKKKELSSETIHYVPKLLAVSHILSQSRRFGIDYWPEVLEWTSIPLERQVSLDMLAAEADVDRELLHRLNAELLLGISPPDKNYRLKIPLAQLPLIKEVLQREDLKLLRYHHYVVKYGDTLSALSRHYGIPLNFIEQHNPGITNRYLKIGETVLIPAYREMPPSASGPAETLLSEGRLFDGRHLVKKGETLWSLSIKYGIDPQTLAEANNMELNQILSEGRTLKVPIMEE